MMLKNVYLVRVLELDDLLIFNVNMSFLPFHITPRVRSMENLSRSRFRVGVASLNSRKAAIRFFYEDVYFVRLKPSN